MRNASLDLRRVIRIAPVVFVGLLVVVVAGVGLVGFLAETQGTWRWYFRMEQAIAAATPVALGLTGATILSLFGAVLVADE